MSVCNREVFDAAFAKIMDDPQNALKLRDILPDTGEILPGGCAAKSELPEIQRYNDEFEETAKMAAATYASDSSA